MIIELSGKYEPRNFESKIYDFWMEKKYFHAKIDKDKKPFSMVIPPPNVTGSLHIGHALNNDLQDAVARYKRMKGFSVCWVPGTDHAGIATQNVVEKELNSQEITRFELGREKFIAKVWEWKEKYGTRIISQLKTLGCSCDWDRERFTFDDDYVKAVNREFSTLYQQGLIYRGKYIINWCPRCLTAISDIEVEHKQTDGKLWDIKYPLYVDGGISNNQSIVVSTTRPETMLGDTAVAVHPNDQRYAGLVGKSVYLPIAQRIIPIIADEHVDEKFGTGAVKVTPAHDPNDFEIGKRHNLKQINIMNDDAVLNESTGQYSGLDRYEARKKIIEQLEELGYLVGAKDHVLSAGYCSRCATVVEPRVSLQWFVSMEKMAKPAIDAVKDARVQIIPKKWEKIYFGWMENIKDWCISRQLWWGHRIPVWYCQDCSEMIVTDGEAPHACSKCDSTRLEQDQDVLDTWFSSCLWPFAVLGWPEKSRELDYFFPTTLLVTGHDIIFFWVARMIMSSIHFMDEVPFSQVFINPLVNDASGQKMSKSKGNVVDPVEIIEKYGSDILRFTLLSLTTPGKNLLLGDDKIEGAKNFANKLWNAAKFVQTNIAAMEDIQTLDIKDMDLNIWDRWILAKLDETIVKVERNLARYNFSFACRLLHKFFWTSYCDWYIESAKVRIYCEDASTDKKTPLYVLWTVLESYLRLLHPFMPFTTELIWQNIAHTGESIMVSSYPQATEGLLDGAPKQIYSLFRIITEIRRIRSEFNIPPSKKIIVHMDAADDDILAVVQDNVEYVLALAKVSQVSYEKPAEREGYIKTTLKEADIYVFIPDVVDVQKEIDRISKEIDKINSELLKVNAKLNNPNFTLKAPADIVAKQRNKANEYMQSVQVLKEQLELIKKVNN